MAERSKRGFASMDAQKQREIASKGGKAAHAKGTAHEFTREEAIAAGRKGGRAAHARSAEQQTVPDAPQEKEPTDVEERHSDSPFPHATEERALVAQHGM